MFSWWVDLVLVVLMLGLGDIGRWLVTVVVGLIGLVFLSALVWGWYNMTFRVIFWLRALVLDLVVGVWV